MVFLSYNDKGEKGEKGEKGKNWCVSVGLTNKSLMSSRPTNLILTSTKLIASFEYSKVTFIVE